MKRLPLILLLGAAVAFQGCESEIQKEDAAEPGFYEYVLNASAGNPQTRTLYDEDQYFSWQAGDKISVLFHKGSTHKFFTFTAESSGASSRFTGTVQSGYSIGASDGKKWGLYPASDQHAYISGETLPVNFYQPASVDFTSDGFSANIPLAALGDENDSYVFMPMCSVAKFSFKDIDAENVTFTVTNTYSHDLSGLFACREGGFVLYWWPHNKGNRTISFTEDVSDGKAVFYVPFTGWDSAGFIPSIELKDNSGTVLYSATASQGFPSSYTSDLGHIIRLPEISCENETPPDPPTPPGDLTKVTYTESTANFANPERGFYMPRGIRSASENAITTSWMSSQRRAGRSLALLEYYLTDFMSSDISAAYLKLMENNFKQLRKGGMKCILRFAYSDNHNGSGPWDATETWVMRHIEQVKPYLQTYGDVIYVLQAGFIGSWGEWYYTTNFGNAGSPNYTARKRVTEALLDAMPTDREVELRTPAFKMRMYNLALKDTLTRATAHDGSTKSRLAGHNDCFLASSSDSGTFGTVTNDRKFWQGDSRYTIMGGETCKVSDYCSCNASGTIPGALSDLEDYHWSYLNIDYNTDVLDIWSDGGCYDEIEKRLGYRIVMEEGWFTTSPKAGEEMDITLRLKNIGFAAPMNPRGAYLVLTDEDGYEIESWPLDSDPRFWMPEYGTITIEKTITLPEGISGQVSLHLNLPDGRDNLAEEPMFSIRLANENMWDADYGYNLLYTFNIAQ